MACWVVQGVLALNVSVPGLGKRFMLTKTLEWNLNWCLLDTMLDHNFQIKEEFTHDVKRLQWRFRCSFCPYPALLESTGSGLLKHVPAPAVVLVQDVAGARVVDPQDAMIRLSTRFNLPLHGCCMLNPPQLRHSHVGLATGILYELSTLCAG